MDILFMGGTFPKDMERDILHNSKGLVQYAANKLQWNLIEGFNKINEVNINVLSAPFIGAYPNGYKKIKFKGLQCMDSLKVNCNYISFSNLWGYRNISRRKSLIKHTKEFISLKAPDKVIMIYSSHTPLIQAAVYAKKKDPSIHICLIVPDLPQYMNMNEKKSLIYSGLKVIDIKTFQKNLGYVNSFVLLTEQMKDMLQVGDRPYTIVEGTVNASQIDVISSEKNKSPKTIVYTGSLNEKYGVINLVKAFHSLDDKDITLELCGRGDAEDKIKDYMQKDQRIKLLGQLSNDEALVLQQKALALVNPRQNNEEFTKYSFPSKNLEYLITGNPVIAYKLDGIPDEYDKYFYYVRDNSIEALRDKIKEVIDLSSKERYEYGKSARDFVLSKKNNIEVSKKIFNMINLAKDR
jgi:glycosyltransferase involved in cell wall biosynthesis